VLYVCPGLQAEEFCEGYVEPEGKRLHANSKQSRYTTFSMVITMLDWLIQAKFLSTHQYRSVNKDVAGNYATNGIRVLLSARSD